ARYQQLARAAWGGQTYETEDGRPLSFDDFNQATIMAMYTSDLWPALNVGLSAIQTAPTEDAWLMVLSEAYAGRDEDGTYALDLAAVPTIWCTDSGPEPGFNDDVEGQIQFIKDYYAAAPFTDPRTDEDPERGLEPSDDWCTYYEENFTLPTAETLRATTNILTVSTTFESATPFDQGVAAAAAIGSTLLIAAATITPPTEGSNASPTSRTSISERCGCGPISPARRACRRRTCTPTSSPATNAP